MDIAFKIIEKPKWENYSWMMSEPVKKYIEDCHEYEKYLESLKDKKNKKAL